MFHFETQILYAKESKILTCHINRGSMQALDRYISLYQVPSMP